MQKRIALASVLAWCSMTATAVSAQPSMPPVPSSNTRLVDVGGRHVAFHIMPGKPPAVVFEAGAGMDSTAWDKVVGTIQRRTGAELITFDRPGFGDSDEDKRPVAVQHEVDDLKAGLIALGATHDIVLVAHSYGGEIGTSFVMQNPGWVTRAVLIDTSIPSFATDDVTARLVAGFPKDTEQKDKEGRTMSATFAAFPALQHALHSMHWPKSIPAAVIISEHPPFATPDLQALWTKDHIDFAHEAVNRSVSIAKDSGHLIMIDRPDLVSEAVIAAIEQARHTEPH